MLDIDTCVAEARTLHPSNDGWFAVLQKNPARRQPFHNLFRMDRLDDVVRLLDRAPDAYLSQGSFIRARRLVSTFKSINCAFVDIDCYKLSAHNRPRVPDEAFVRDLLANAREAGIPEPSYVTYSGQGVYCKWVFDRPITAHQLTRWQALQNVLVPLYTAFGADASARDAARVLRVMGSSHAEAGSIVRVGHSNNTRHSFDDLCRAAEAIDVAKLVWPSARKVETGKERTDRPRKVRAPDSKLLLKTGDLGVLEQFSQAKQPFMMKFGSTDHLNWSRFIDLRTLAELRGGILPGSRDLMMFWMGTFLGHAGVVTSATFEKEMGSLLAAFSGADFKPLEDGSMVSLIARLKGKEAGRRVRFRNVDYDPLYTPTNAHLIDALQITAGEQEQLATIISAEEKLRRADGKTPGRAERREARIQWRGLARDLATQAQAEGRQPSVSEISRTVGVDKAQVSRLLSGKLDRDPSAVETRGRKKTGIQGRRVVVARNGALARTVVAAPDPISPSCSIPPAQPDLAPIQPLSQPIHHLSNVASNPWASLASSGRSVTRGGRAPRAAAGPVRPQRAPVAAHQMPGRTSAPGLPSDRPGAAHIAPVAESSLRPEGAGAVPAAGRHHEQLLLQLASEQLALRAVNRLEEIRRRAFGRPSPGLGVETRPTATSPPAGGSTQESIMATSADRLAKGRDTSGAPAQRPSSPASHLAAAVAVERRAPADPGADHRDPAAVAPAAPDAGAPPPARKPCVPNRTAFSALAQRAAERRRPDAAPVGRQQEAVPDRPPAGQVQADPPWDNPDIPAGSQYTEEEWGNARAIGDVDVCELRSGAEGALVTIARDPERHARRHAVSGHTAPRSQPAAKARGGDFPPLLGLLIDGCLLLGPKAPTTHPGAVTGHINLRLEDGEDWPYRIVRPAAQVHTHRWMTSVTGRLEWGSGAVARQILSQDACARNSKDGDHDGDAEPGFEKMRG